MNSLIDSVYRKIPSGYPKSVIKNGISYILYRFSFGVDECFVNGEKIYLYKDRVFDNKILAKEVEGYNKKYSLKKGDIVVDGGAYSGLFSIYASKKVGKSGKVIAFEPDPYNVELLKRNLKLNKVSSVRVIKKGLYSKDDVLKFDIQGISSKLELAGQHNQETINKVPVVSLDSELKRLKIKSIDFVKMDIEGAEVEAVLGCRQIIKNSKNIHFAIASYHLVNGEKTYHFLEKFFKQMKMFATTGHKNHLTTYAEKRSTSTAIKA